MPGADDMAVQRELGAIGQHLRSIDEKLTEVVRQTTATNGRVTTAESDIAVLKDRVEQHRARIEDKAARPRLYMLAVVGPIVAVVLTEVAQNVHF